MYQLNPDEKLELKVESTPKIKVQKESGYLLVLGIILVLVALFYNFASKQDYILNFITIASAIGSVIAFVAYFVMVNNANKTPKEIYYITNTRVIAADTEGNLIQDVLRKNIKRIEGVNVARNKGDIVINPRLLDPQAKYKQELKGNRQQKYTKDTFILKNVAHIREILETVKG